MTRFNAPMRLRPFLSVGLSICFLSLFSQTPVFAAYEIIGKNLTEVKAPHFNDNYEIQDGYQQADLAGITLSNDSYYISSIDGFLEKRALSHHHIIWRTKLSAVSQSSWTVDQNQVFGGDTKGQFYAIDTKSGNILWKASTKGVFFSRPLVHADQVFVTTSHGMLQAYDRNNGNWLWQQSDPGTGTLGLWSSEGPAWFQDHVITGFASGTLVAFDPQSGKSIWNETFSDKVQVADNFNDLKSIHASTDFLFASSFSGNLRAWESVKGSKKLIWEKRISLHAPMTIDEKTGILYASARDGKVYALDIHTGFLKWEYELPRGLGTQPTLSKDAVWVGTSSGLVVALDHTGKLLAKSNDYQMPIWNALIPALDDEMLALTGRGFLRRLQLVQVSR